MKISANTPDEYIAQLPEERQEAMKKLRETILAHIPEGFEEVMSYGMIGYVVPHTRYPNGYHANPELPLPFISIASQKHHIGFYHMGLYNDERILQWFIAAYPEHSKTKLDMGKSCVRFKKMDNIPFELIAALLQKIEVDTWIHQYEHTLLKK